MITGYDIRNAMTWTFGSLQGPTQSAIRAEPKRWTANLRRWRQTIAGRNGVNVCSP